MFKHFRNSELGVIALALEEKDNNWISQHAKKKRKWVHNVWESITVKGQFYTLLPHQ